MEKEAIDKERKVLQEKVFMLRQEEEALRKDQVREHECPLFLSCHNALPIVHTRVYHSEHWKLSGPNLKMILLGWFSFQTG